MPVERAGYTVTMFLVDISPAMGTLKTVEFTGPDGETISKTMSHLEYVLRFVKLKIQEMIFNGRKTDQCGVIVFGSEETNNTINDTDGGYDNVSEYIPIGQPNSDTLAKLDELRPSTRSGDAIDGIIVGFETQHKYLASKRSWTRKMFLLTNAESPLEFENWETSVKKMDLFSVSLTIVGVDFDDEDFPYAEPNKTVHKRVNEEFFHKLTSTMKAGTVGNCAYALQEISKPDIKAVRSALLGSILRLGDVETQADEAIEILVKASKCTSMSRPKSWKKYALREDDSGQSKNDKSVYAPLKMRTEFYVDRTGGNDKDVDGDVKMEEGDVSLHHGSEVKDEDEKKEENLEKVHKEELVKGFKYGTTYVPCPDGQFARLHTKKGIDICGFIDKKNFRRDWSIGDIQYIWADPASPQQQVAFSSVVQAMYEKGTMAIARWVSRDGMDPKMGILSPVPLAGVDCLLWAQMPFADDIRRYTFASLDKLVSKSGERIEKHPYIPTEAQQEAMDDFVDAMDLMTAGEKDEEGNRTPWFNTTESYNPSIHRTKQAMFHCAVVPDIASNPLPPPHPVLLQFFNPPRKVLKRAKGAIEQCQDAFKVKQVPKRVVKAAAKGHEHAGEDDEMLLLDHKQEKPGGRPVSSAKGVIKTEPISPAKNKGKAKAANSEGSDTEDDEDEEYMMVDDEGGFLLDGKPVAMGKPTSRPGPPLPTPARSVSPSVDPGRAPGRIIGSTYPLKDFEKNIAQGDVITKAVEDLCEVILEIVLRPFASRRSEEMIKCMKLLRDTCLKEDEIDAWNAFLLKLKEKCFQKPGNLEFWSEVKSLGRNASLISNKEARQYGGAASVSEKRAEEFIA